MDKKVKDFLELPDMQKLKSFNADEMKTLISLLKLQTETVLPEEFFSLLADFSYEDLMSIITLITLARDN